jgi:hypothetical protein
MVGTWTSTGDVYASHSYGRMREDAPSPLTTAVSHGYHSPLASTRTLARTRSVRRFEHEVRISPSFSYTLSMKERA